MRSLLSFPLLLVAVSAFAEPPRAVDERLEITLFAEHPTIVTPTGIDVDHAGRVWAIESNTHFPPVGYERHDSDRLYVMQDTDGDGRADDVKVFADGFTHTMSVAVRPVWLDPVATVDGKPKGQPRQVFLAERGTIWLLEDLDDDLKCDKQTKLVRLETPGNYPHNGLAGFAFDAMGWMYFGFGENLGAKYTIHGSDGTKLSGGGEGGNVYRCRPDGSKLQLWATGFWNPHASCVDAFGRLFTVDNDPDSRPPCRLLHVIEGGDYGFKFRNGRKGLHPFTSWNGEVPGTLPMVSGTGEAPSGIVAYESDGLPKDYLGNLLVTSWGDHRIDRFRLEPKGASFTSVPEPIVQGDDEFRPVGLATAPDGSLFCTDWVKRDYKLHGHGRIWRIRWKDRPEAEVVDARDITPDIGVDRLAPMLRSSRLDVRRTASRMLGESDAGANVLTNTLADGSKSERVRIESLWTIARTPIDERDFGLRMSDESNAPIAYAFDDVAAALARVRSDQFPVPDRPSFGTTWFRPAPKHSLTRDQYNRFEFALSSQLLDGKGVKHERALDSSSEKALDSLPEWRPTDDVSGPFELARDVRQLLRFGRFLPPSSMQIGWLPSYPGEEPARLRLALVLASRWQRGPFASRFAPPAVLREGLRPDPTLPNGLASSHESILRLALTDPSPDVRRLAVQWTAEDELHEYRPLVAAGLELPGVTPDLFRATIAALQMLDGVDPKQIDRTPPTQYVMSLVRDTERPASVRALALRMLGDGAGRDPKAKFDAALAKELLAADSPELRLETMRTLQTIRQPFAVELARTIADDPEADTDLRAEAVVALGTSPTDADRDVLLGLLKSDDEGLRREALRSLRPLAKSDEVVSRAIGVIDDAELGEAVALARGEKPGFSEEARLREGGDAAAGRRLFFHASGPGCAKCHTVGGRGGNVGPDLSLVSRTMDRRKLAESILEPSKEVAPQFTNWTFVMTDGKVRNGMILRQTRKLFEIGTPEGERIEFSSDLVETRSPQKTSVMPAKLHDRMTSREFRDLLAYLESLK